MLGVELCRASRQIGAVGTPADVHVVEYSPEDVIGETTYASTVGYSIGGSITDTGGSVSGSYSAAKTTSYSVPDVSIDFTGGLIDPHAYWYEDIQLDKPQSTGELLTGYKVVWADDSADNGAGFDINVHVQTAIMSYYSSPNNTGRHECLPPDGRFYNQFKLQPPWESTSAGSLCQIEVLDFDQVVHVGGNLAPRAP